VTAPPGVLDYFALEAADCMARVERWAEGAADAADAADAAQAARALRGAATVARQPEFASAAAAIERAVGALAAAPGRPDVRAADAVVGALDAFRGALRAPRPLPPADADRLRGAAAALDALGAPPAPPEGRPAEAAPASPALPGGPAAGADGRVVPIRALARDGDADFVVRRAPNPPATADQRFRAASVPLARALRQLVADARAAGVGDAGRPGADLVRTLGADLSAALADLRELADSYDVRPVAAFFAGREPGAAALDPRTLAAVDAAAAGLVDGRPAVPAATPPTPSTAVTPAATPAAAPAPFAFPTPAVPAPAQPAPPAPALPGGPPGERGDAFRPVTGDALVALLETGISGFGHVHTLEEAVPVVPAAAAPDGPAPHAGAPNGSAPAPARGPSDVVPVEALLYSGRAALERARAVRDALRAGSGAPDPALLDELYDLLDLAAAG
jgi:hypothetical protein